MRNDSSYSKHDWRNICQAISASDKELKFNQFYRHTFNSLLSYLLGFDNCDVEQAETIVQDILYNTYLNLDDYCNKLKYDPVYNLKGYLTTSAKYAFFQFLRKQKKIDTAEKEFYSENDDDNPIQQKEWEETQNLILNLSRECQKELTQRKDQIISLRYLEKKSIKDIAEEFGFNYSSLRGDIPKWLKEIRKCTEKKMSHAE